MNVLLKFKANYGDEFDLYGFAVKTEAEWIEHQEIAKIAFEEKGAADREFGFGTNESLQFYDVEDYLSCFQVTKITNEEAAVLKQLFSCSYSDDIGFGHYVGADELID